MKYTAKSFTVPASAGSAATCERWGHTMPDVHGKCVRCGEAIKAVKAVAPEGGDWTPFAEGDISAYVRLAEDAR